MSSPYALASRVLWSPLVTADGPSVTRSPTHTVDDAPASEDEFGSHAPIAAAVRELITTEPGGRTIGLEGSWGSGKSTVVKLLNDQLDGSGVHVVVFDAWAHEGDPLRRSFLETLIKSISAKGWIEEQSWRERCENLARRRRVEHTRPVSRIERPTIIAGIFAAFFAILVPLGAAFVEAGLAADRNRWAFWIGVAVYVVLAALIAIGAAWLLRGRSGPASGALLSLFSVESVTESTRETIETPDPTSVEFESTFRDLMREALANDQARRLVLVVDNLDRVSAADARSIWATLQTFLHHSHDNREPWLDSLWVLLPYDRDGIARLWDESATVVSDEPQPGATLADSFIDKSIQVRFEVPLPLLSDWRAYVESTLRLALPNCAEADGYAAYRLYAHRLADSGRAPSPREIKQYINRIGALHRRWQDELPFASLAYYASLGVDGVEVADRLRRGTLPESRSLLEIMMTAPGHLLIARDEIVGEGIALEYVWLASEQGDDGALGDWLYEEIRQFTPESWTTRSYSGYAPLGKNLVDALLADPSTQPIVPLAQSIERRRDFDVIASIGANVTGEALAAALVTELWQSDRFTAALDGDLFRAVWPHIARAGAADALDIDDIVRAICERPKLVPELESSPFAKNLLSMYTAVIAAHPDRGEAARLAEWVAGRLSALNLNQWQTLMAESDDWVALLDAIRGAAASAQIRGAYGQALAEFLESIANGEKVTTLTAEQWERAVVPLLAPAVEGTYAEGIARAAVNAGGGLPEAFFALVGNTLKEPRLFFRTEIRNGLLPNLVTERNTAGFSWLIDTLQSEDVRRNAPADAFDALAEVVRTCHSQDEDDGQQLQRIATLIGLDLQPRPDE